MRIPGRLAAAGYAALLIFAMASYQSPHAEAGFSTTFQVNARHDGVAQEAPPASEPRALWSRDLGFMATFPVIADGRLFVRVLDSQRRNQIYALDLATGETLWVRGAPTPYGLSYGQGRLYMTDSEGLTRALDPVSGRTLWAEQELGWGREPPVYVDGVVYTTAVRSSYDWLQARSADDGRLLWRREVMSIGGGTLAVHDGAIFISSSCDSASYDADTGATRWTRVTGCTGGGGSTPVVTPRGVFVQDQYWDGDLILDTQTGDDVGAFSSVTPPAVSGSRGLFIQSGALVAIDLDTDAEIWRFAPETPVALPPVVIGDRVVAVTESGEVHWLDLATGAARWSGVAGNEVTDHYETDDNFSGTAAAEGVFAVPANGTVSAFAYGPVLGAASPQPEPLTDQPPQEHAGNQAVAYGVNAAHDGFLDAANPRPPLRLRWAAAGGANMSFPLIADGRIFVVDEGGEANTDVVRAFDQVDGSLIWTREVFGDPAGLAYEDDRVFVLSGAGTFTPGDNTMRALRALDGAELWATQLPGIDEGTGAPTAYGGMVYVEGETSTPSKRLFALDSEEGGVLWTRRTSGYYSASAPATDGENIYPSSLCGEVGAFELTRGTPVWGPDADCSPPPIWADGPASVVHGGRVYGGEGFIHSATTGEVLDRLQNNVTPVVAGNLVVNTFGRYLEVLDRTGFRRWEWIGGTEDNLLRPVIVGETLFAAAWGGAIRAFDLRTGALVWSGSMGPLTGRVFAGSSPRIAGVNAGEGLIAVGRGDRLVVYESAPLAETPNPPNPDPSDPGPQGPRDTDPPSTSITFAPKRVVRGARARFRFTSDEAGAKFACRLDEGPWKACRSPLSSRFARLGRHRFSVRAVDAAGNLDRSPASRAFSVVRPRRPRP